LRRSLRFTPQAHPQRAFSPSVHHARPSRFFEED
jgi:hypothetical protein